MSFMCFRVIQVYHFITTKNTKRAFYNPVKEGKRCIKQKICPCSPWVFPLFIYICLMSSLSFPPQGTRKLEYGGSTWHEGCFICNSCEQPIGSKSFIPDKDEHYCVSCYEDKFAPRCTRCKKVSITITSLKKLISDLKKKLTRHF